MNMIEAMTGTAEVRNEVAEECYEKSGALIGGLAGAMVEGVAGLVLGGITGVLTGGDGSFSGAFRGAMIGVLSGVALGGIGGALIERKPKRKRVYQLIRNKIQLEENDEFACVQELDETGVEKDHDARLKRLRRAGDGCSGAGLRFGNLPTTRTKMNQLPERK